MKQELLLIIDILDILDIIAARLPHGGSETKPEKELREKLSRLRGIIQKAIKESEEESKPMRLPRGGMADLKSVDLHDKTKHGWSGPIASCGLWTMGYHVPSKRTGLVVILRVFGETKEQCLRRKKRVADALDGILIEEVSE